MFIIVEGTDGSGKSTVIDYIKKNTKCKEYDFNDKYRELRILPAFEHRFNKLKSENMIFHRFHISQWVYDFTLRNSYFDLQHFEKKVFGNYLNDIYLIHIDIDSKIAWKRILERDNKMETQNLSLDREVFKFAYNKSLIKNKISIYNNHIKKTKNEIAKFLNFK
jgi:thymidylate kinase